MATDHPSPASSAPQTRFWSRLARRRTAVQLVSSLAINSYVTRGATLGLLCPALNCYACPAAAFACPVGTLQHFVVRREFPFYGLGIVGLVGALVGRGSCGWFCPFGWIQDLVYRLPVPKLRLANRLNWIRYIILAGLVVLLPLATGEPWFCKLCPAGSLEAGIPLAFIDAHVRTLIGTFYWLKIGLLGGFLAWMSLTRRPFCRWVCPLGTLWSLWNPVSAVRLHVDRETCIACNRCQEVCPVNLRIHENPTSGVCIRCLQCLDACPTGALSVTSPAWSLEADRTGVPGSEQT